MELASEVHPSGGVSALLLKEERRSEGRRKGCFVYSEAFLHSYGHELNRVHKLFVALETCPCCSFPSFAVARESSASARTEVFWDH